METITIILKKLKSMGVPMSGVCKKCGSILHLEPKPLNWLLTKCCSCGTKAWSNNTILFEKKNIVKC
jgi:hypothetical protein